MPKTVHQIKLNLNLLHPQGIPLKLTAKILKWLLSFGRYIGIIVEILVLVTFATRFKLDSDLADINEKINQQIPYIENLSSQELSIKQTQFKLAVIKKNFSSLPNWQNVLNKISAQIPKGTILKSLNFEHSKTSQVQFKLVGLASSNSDLAILLSGLKKDPTFKDVGLAALNLDDAGLNFTITGAVK